MGEKGRVKNLTLRFGKLEVEEGDENGDGDLEAVAAIVDEQ